MSLAQVYKTWKPAASNLSLIVDNAGTESGIGHLPSIARPASAISSTLPR